jgi:hypothetical protein
MKLGKRPARHDPRTLKLSNYLTSLPTAPDPIDWTPAVTVPWGMYMNGADPTNPPSIPGGVGDCFWAGMAHALMTWTANAGSIFVPTNNDVLVGYESTGFNPSDPSTDNGTVMLDGLKYMRTTGIGGYKIGAFVAVNPKDHAEVMSALYLFGALLIGVQFPSDWMSAQVWDTSNSAIEGGHFVVGVKGSLSAALIEIITWGAGRSLTFAGADQNCDELYVTLPPEWLLPGSTTAPNHIDIAALQADLAAVTQ